MNIRKSIGVTVLLFGASLCGVSLTANAGVVCNITLASKVTPTSECQLGDTNNDSQTAVNIVVDPNDVLKIGMFGFMDWIFAQKIEFETTNVLETNLDIGLNIASTGTDTISGTWAINDVWNMYSHVMLVLKDGNGVPPVYVGYQVTSGATSGNYATPFSNSNNPKDISHISAYVRGTGTVPVPEPGTLALFGIGLIGFSLVRRKRGSIS